MASIRAPGSPTCSAVCPIIRPAVVAALQAMVVARDQMIEALKLTIAKLQHARHGASSERGRKLLDQLELQLAELQECIAEEAAAELAAPSAEPSSTQDENGQIKPARRPLPEHLPRERVVHAAPAACPCCGGNLRKLGEDVTETLEYVPARWKVIQHVREKFSCRKCEAIAQAPAPFHPISRGRAGPQLLAQILFSKYRAHLPLNRQSEIYAGEGIDLNVSTLADWVGASAATLMPLVEAISDHVFAAERIHADDTPVPVLARGRTRTGRLWTYWFDPNRPIRWQVDFCLEKSNHCKGLN
jgi:transposase